MPALPERGMDDRVGAPQRSAPSGGGRPTRPPPRSSPARPSTASEPIASRPRVPVGRRARLQAGGEAHLRSDRRPTPRDPDGMIESRRAQVAASAADGGARGSRLPRSPGRFGVVLANDICAVRTSMIEPVEAWVGARWLILARGTGGRSRVRGRTRSDGASRCGGEGGGGRAGGGPRRRSRRWVLCG